jgi:hypothetical protein
MARVWRYPSSRRLATIETYAALFTEHRVGGTGVSTRSAEHSASGLLVAIRLRSAVLAELRIGRCGLATRRAEHGSRFAVTHTPRPYTHLDLFAQLTVVIISAINAIPAAASGHAGAGRRSGSATARFLDSSDIINIFRSVSRQYVNN